MNRSHHKTLTHIRDIHSQRTLFACACLAHTYHRWFCSNIFQVFSTSKLITSISFNVFQLDIGKQFVGRAITLIVWPILLYMCFFYIHLEVLNHSGSGDGFFSTAFQSQLIGNSLHNATMPRQVAYGAVVTFKNHKTGGGYLHSHSHLYPKGVGIRQQQVNWSTKFIGDFVASPQMLVVCLRICDGCECVRYFVSNEK